MNPKPIKISGTLMWAFLDKMNELAKKYTVDVCHLSEEDVKKLEASGAQVRQKDGKGFYITCKSLFEIKPVDTKGNSITEKVGNGTKADLIVNFYDHKFSKQHGLGIGVKNLTITDLVVYNGPSYQDEEDEVVL